MPTDSVIVSEERFVYAAKMYLNFPLATDLRLGVVIGNQTAQQTITGTLDLPGVSHVEAGVQYDNATKTGTYVSAGSTQIGGKSEVFGG